MDGAMRIDVKKVSAQAAAPVTVLALLLAIIAGVMAGQRLGRVSRKPIAADSRALVARVQGTLDSLQRQAADTSYPLEEAIQVIKAKYPPPTPPVVVAVAPPARVVEGARPAPPPPPEPVLRISGIISNKDLVLVCVNNRLLGVGGSVEGFKVVKIEPHLVTFDDQKGRIRMIKIK